ncbi:hypothetical protein [Planomicrobium sp. Y74]|uniref:hypothetical protein n=1 Tax=Planomicrobium sp. Y74 TaxID=2478977 RepID=UPI000EF498B5|nr:hypothetical protein [Planomicrobium sp. Y74]RLQ92114.1 hypothetical protein D9754_04840 [Planomicrobium sp. Y74]
MVKLIKVILKLSVEGKSKLLEFEDFMSRYNKLEADKIEEELQKLQDAEMIEFQREEFGFRILVTNTERLMEYIYN